MTRYVKRYFSDGKEYAYFRPPRSLIELGVKPRRIALDELSSIEEEVQRAIALEGRRLNLERLGDLERHVRRMTENAKHRARKRALPFALSPDDVHDMLGHQGFLCALTGITFDLSPIADAFRRPYAPSIDRVERQAGYVRSNVRLVCIAVNIARSDWGDDVLMAVAEGLVSGTKKHSNLSEDVKEVV